MSTFCGHRILEKAAFAINAVSIGLAVQTLIDMIFENDNVRKRNEICQKMEQNGGRAKVITSVYEYSTGSGNSYTWYTTQMNING